MAIHTGQSVSEEYHTSLILSEMSQNTIRKYTKDIADFMGFAGCPAEIITKETALSYKEHLKQRYKANTVNSRLLSLNRFFAWLGREDLKVKTERVQHHRCIENVLSEEEYRCLLRCAAESGKHKIFLIMKTLACTGIRVGELHFITREAAAAGKNTVENKGKRRDIFLPENLCALLLDYCDSIGVDSGTVFRGNSDKPLDHSSIWRTLKRLAKKAQVDPAKVYPHSFRHLFAKTYLKKFGNIAELADILGHSSIETTRIYLVSSLEEKRSKMNELNL